MQSTKRSIENMNNIMPPNLVYSNAYRKYQLHKSPFFSQDFEEDVPSPGSRLFPIVGPDGNPGLRKQQQMRNNRSDKSRQNKRVTESAAFVQVI